MRRRYRYLSHFSLTTTFQVRCCLSVFNVIAVCLKFLIIIHPFFQLCEIDLSELLPTESLIPFMDEIKKREKQRKQVARKVLLAMQCNIVYFMVVMLLVELAFDYVLSVLLEFFSNLISRSRRRK